MINVTVNGPAGNTPPIATFTWSGDMVAGSDILLDGTSSSDLDGDPLTFTWEILSPTFAKKKDEPKLIDNGVFGMITFKPKVAATYDIQLTVSDGTADDIVVETLDIAEKPPKGGGGGNSNDPPIASFTVGDCPAPFTSDSCFFVTDTSSDPDGTIDLWSWDFGDGDPPDPPTVSTVPGGQYVVIYGTDPAVYTVELTVTDNEGATDIETYMVVVGPPPPLVLVSASGYKVKGVQTVDLTWTGGPMGTIEILRTSAGAADVTTATDNDEFEAHSIGLKGGASYEFQICETGGANCSDPLPVVF